MVIGNEPFALHRAPFEVPAISDPLNDQHLVGKVIWRDLETTDLDGSKRFYQALLGWDYRDYRANGVVYTVALANGIPVAGLERRPIVRETERPAAWLLFFSVADVDATFRLALSAHAQVLSEPVDKPLRGREARLTDPEGAVFAIVNSSSGDPPDGPNAGSVEMWGTPSLMANDPATEAVFYQTVFGYVVIGAPTDHGFERIRLQSAGQERATVDRLHPGTDSLRPQWISYARVPDIAETVQLAVKLGGRVLLAAHPAPNQAIAAILEDPTGAAFGVFEAR
jgi:predicted enzyme related to lactoylglutathione lyase